MTQRQSIRSWWNKATNLDHSHGVVWYPGARSLIESLCMEYRQDRRIVAGIVAALSQQCRWSTNIDRARHVLDGRTDIGGLPLAVDKALRILDGHDPIATLGSRAFKIQAFYLALLGDDDAAVIDTWMLKALDWTGGYSRLQYQGLSDLLAEEAAAAGVTVTTYQATVWCVIRGAAE